MHEDFVVSVYVFSPTSLLLLLKSHRWLDFPDGEIQVLQLASTGLTTGMAETGMAPIVSKVNGMAPLLG